MKNSRGTARLTMLVDKLRLPLTSNVLVNTGTQLVSGVARFVLSSSTKVPLTAPFVAVRFNVVPFSPILVMSGVGGTGFGATMVIEPFTFRLLIQELVPVRAGSVTEAKFTGWLNNWKVAACWGPRLVTTSVAVESIVKPGAINSLQLGVVVAFTLIVTAPASSALPVTVKLPTGRPTLKVEPASASRMPRKVPIPSRVWPETTSKRLFVTGNWLVMVLPFPSVVT